MAVAVGGVGMGEVGGRMHGKGAVVQDVVALWHFLPSVQLGQRTCVRRLNSHSSSRDLHLCRHNPL